MVAVARLVLDRCEPRSRLESERHMSMRRTLFLQSVLLVTLATACSKKPPAPAEAESSRPAAAAPRPSAAAEPGLISAAPVVPAGIVLSKSTLAGIGTMALPGGAGWERTDGPPFELSNDATMTTVMAQFQGQVSPDTRDEYVAAFIEANTRDAPKYKVTGKANGELPGGPGARVDGTFDNGDAFATRDYLVFAKGGVAALMVRGPVADAAKVRALADAIASSYRAP